jgi:UDP-N-acetylmuramate dehydrogenase
VKVATAAAEAGIDGLDLLSRHSRRHRRGALHERRRCYGTETRDRMVERARDAPGEIVTLQQRRHGLPLPQVERAARTPSSPARLLQGFAGDKDDILNRMREITEKRESSQPTKAKTGGSTFKNPEGHSSWKLIDAAGCRGLTFGDAQMSELHANFLINTRRAATAADIEALGEEVRARVKAHSGVDLHWEIRRIG